MGASSESKTFCVCLVLFWSVIDGKGDGLTDENSISNLFIEKLYFG